MWMYNRILKKVSEYLTILLGTVIISLALNLFLVPNKISSGGVTTIGTVLLYLFGIPLSVTNIIFNIFLFLFAYKYLNRDSVVKTVAGVLFLSFFLQLTSSLPRLSDNFFISSVSGGILMGLGTGLVLRKSASTGGSDLFAMLLNRILPHISVPVFLMIIDFSVIVISGLVFKSFEITFYSALSILIFSKVTDALLTMGNYAKSVYILSDKADEISLAIMALLKRGITGIHSVGMYSRDEQTMLMCITSPKELPTLIDLIRKTDNRAFVIISDVREVFGNGFDEKTLHGNAQ